MPTKLGMAAWVIVELLLGAAVGYFAWHLFYAQYVPYIMSRYNLG